MMNIISQADAPLFVEIFDLLQRLPVKPALGGSVYFMLIPAG
jgi:hypothetical protein